MSRKPGNNIDKLKNNGFEQDQSSNILFETYQELSTELPPESVDSNILSAAHQAIDEFSTKKNTKSAPVNNTGVTTTRAWYVPVSYVAILVLSLSVVMKLAFEPQDLLSPAPEFDSRESLETEAASIMNEHKPNQKTQHAEKRKADLQVRMKTQQRTLSQEKRVKILREKHHLEGAQRRALDDSRAGYALEKKTSKKSESISENISTFTVLPITARKTASDNLPTEEEMLQKNTIDELMRLYETEKFERLKIALKKYRSDFKGRLNNEKLPAVLLSWEQENGLAD